MIDLIAGITYTILGHLAANPELVIIGGGLATAALGLAATYLHTKGTR